MRIQLGDVIADQTCTIEYFLHPSGGERGIVIVFPGGGYEYLSKRESEPVAKKFVELGFHAAVCRYRVNPAVYPVPLEDARNAVKYTREHAAELGIKPDKIAVMGFSAGGHLAAMLSNDPGSPEARPDAAVLCYAVLSSKHQTPSLVSFKNLLPGVSADEYIKCSCPEAVSANTPPTFLWHTFGDTNVLPEHSIDYALALKQYNIDSELHIYPRGVHGLALGDRPGHETEYRYVESWVELCRRFLHDRNW